MKNRVFLTTVVMVLIGLGLMGCQGQPVEPDVVPEELDQSETSGRELYERHCAMCHASSGVGTAMVPGNIKFNSAEWQKTHTDEELAAIITNGSGSMPAFGDKLTEEEVKQIVSHIRSLAN